MNAESPVPTVGGGVWPRVVGSSLAAALLCACTPAFDWRSVPLPETPLVAQFPCKPGRFQRDVVVAGVPLKLFMLSCEAGGITYGVASADVGDPTRVESVLAGLEVGAEAAIRSQQSRVESYDIAGATPFRGNVCTRSQGVRPDGQRVTESMRVFGRGTRVYQATAIGATLPESASQPFAEGLRFDLSNPN